MFQVPGWSLDNSQIVVGTKAALKKRKREDRPEKPEKPAAEVPEKKVVESETGPVVHPSRAGRVKEDDEVQKSFEKVTGSAKEVAASEEKPAKKRKRGGKGNKAKEESKEGADKGSTEVKEDKAVPAAIKPVAPSTEADADKKESKYAKKKRLRREEAAKIEAAGGVPPPKPAKPVKVKHVAPKPEKSQPTSEALARRLEQAAANAPAEPEEEEAVPEIPPALPPMLLRPADKLTTLQQKMQQKLSGARFRWINERLYTTTGAKALELMKDQPEMFTEYHEGFRNQVQSWPENPVDVFIRQLKDRRKANKLPKDGKGVTTVIDLGCGDAKIGQTFTAPAPDAGKDLAIKSYDLRSVNPLVTAADIANLPLANESVDIAIFCLALMGTDFIAFLREARRVLRVGGELWIAEIRSRFADAAAAEDPSSSTDKKDKGGKNKDKAGAEANAFVKRLNGMGFKHSLTDGSNKMFVRMEFTKEKEVSKKKEDGGNVLEEARDEEGRLLLKPCVYKKR
ncbi:25S rRNA (adenine645-N1)-methyltransferase [Saitoella coloradoensis]